jgi:hypothetical protein
MAVFWAVATCRLFKFTNASEVLTASIIRAMSEAARGESAEIKGSESDKAELGRTCGKGQYQARAWEPVGEDGGATVGC